MYTILWLYIELLFVIQNNKLHDRLQIMQIYMYWQFIIIRGTPIFVDFVGHIKPRNLVFKDIVSPYIVYRHCVVFLFCFLLSSFQFLCIVHFWLPLRYFLTFIGYNVLNRIKVWHNVYVPLGIFLYNPYPLLVLFFTYLTLRRPDLGEISFLKALPICAAAKGSLPWWNSNNRLKFTNIPWAVSGLKNLQ